MRFSDYPLQIQYDWNGILLGDSGVYFKELGTSLLVGN